MKLTVGCVQLNSTADVAANLAAAERLVRQVAEQGAEVILLPEHFSFIGAEEQKRQHAEMFDQVGWLPRFKELADHYQVHIHIGSFLERDGDRIYNTAAVVAPDGRIVARYRKLHLFDVDIPGGRIYRESRVVSGGEDVVTFSIGEFVFGLATCYDLRFPELFRRLIDRGASVFLLPAAFTLHTGRDHWEILLRARAIENLAWVAAAAQWGMAPPAHQSFGRSMVISPWGTVVAQAIDTVTAITAELDLAELQRVRASFPCLQHRRRDLFS